MAPRKSTAVATATRRSARIASREPSQEAAAAPPSAPAEAPAAPVAPVGPSAPRWRRAGKAPAWDVEADIVSITTASFAKRVKFLRGLTADPRVQDLLLELGSRLEDTLEGRAADQEEAERKLAVSRANERPSLRRDFVLAQIQEKYGGKAATGSLPKPAEEERERAAEPSSVVEEIVREAAGTPPSTTSPLEAAVTPAPSSILRRLASGIGALGGLGNLVASPFTLTRKRSAEESTTEPSQKRMRMQETESVQEEEAAQTAQPAREEMVPSPVSPTPTQKGDVIINTAERKPAEDRTPRQIRRKAHSPLNFTGPSAKNPHHPTSLSTITEYTETSRLAGVTDSTPSKPSRFTSAYGLQAPQNTPMHHDPQDPDDTPNDPSSVLTFSSLPQGTPAAFATSSFPQDTPSAFTSSSLSQTTPALRTTITRPGTPAGSIIRRSAVLRARRAMANTPQPPKPFSWERKVNANRPKQPNADIRLEKILRMRELEKQLRELKEDEDIKDIEAHSIHRRKRVKIDSLAHIPHNRPGDSSSTFRVPEPDSDDEIEIEDRMDEDGNSVYEHHAKMQDDTMDEDSPQHPQAAVPKPQTTESSQQTPESYHPQYPRPSHHQAVGQQQDPDEGRTTVNFPNATVSMTQPATTYNFPSTNEQPAEEPLQFNFPNVGTVPYEQQTHHDIPDTNESSFNFPNASDPSEEDEEPQFNFPNVGLKPHDYVYDYWDTEEGIADATKEFAEGFNQWLAAQQ